MRSRGTLCLISYKTTTRLANSMGLDPAHRTPTLTRHVLQQVFSQALIKIYSLVDCPIYSVVKYRPHQLSLITRLGGVWVASDPMFGAKRLS